MRPSKPLLFTLIVTFLLVGYSLLAGVYPFPGSDGPNFLSDIKPAKQKQAAIVRRTIKPPSKPADTVAGAIPYRDYFTYKGIISYEPQRRFALSAFITALRELKAGKRKKLRIAWFGDSMIEGDLITGDLRQLLQDAFGGNGAGFIPVTSVTASFRQTILHRFGSWNDQSFQSSPKATHFLSGHLFTSDSSSTVQYSPVARPHLQRFAQVNALYGNAPLKLLVNGRVMTLPATAGCNKALVSEDCASLKITGLNAAPLYGFSFEDSTGIYLDNFAFRGSSGMDLGALNAGFLKQVSAVHNYDLIIFQYGPNLFTPTAADFSWYEKPMLGVVQKFRAAFPNASLLVMGTADKSYRYKGEMETAVGVEPLLQSQAAFAAAGEINFWNLYRAMGGRNAMLGWVEGEEKLARTDYTHFTQAGARRVAAMLFTELMQDYALAQ